MNLFLEDYWSCYIELFVSNSALSAKKNSPAEFRISKVSYVEEISAWM
jgi:hypothetical protein